MKLHNLDLNIKKFKAFICMNTIYTSNVHSLTIHFIRDHSQIGYCDACDVYSNKLKCLVGLISRVRKMRYYMT